MKFRLSPRWLFAFCCLLMALDLGRVWAQSNLTPAKPPSAPPLTRVSDIHALSENDAALGHPVRVQGVVTFYGGPPVLFVQDPTGGIYVQMASADPGLISGELVEVKGITGHGWFANQIEKAEIRILGRAPLPEPLHPRFEDLSLGSDDGQWVDITGIVHSTQVQEPSRRLVLSVAVGGGRVSVAIQNYRPSVLTNLVDTKIRVQGACGGIFNRRLGRAG